MMHPRPMGVPEQILAPGSPRLIALDGLRGVAAVIVVLFHYLAMLHPTAVPRYSDTPHALADTPLALLWNGEFAVLVFFVLSGFVMAAAAERRADKIVPNIVTRYFRLALPMVASVVLALLWLTLFPTAARDLAAQLSNPSVWLSYTVQGDLPSIWAALFDGAVGSLITGASPINNVLWTMQVEFVGSVALFVVYWLGRNSTGLRFAALAGFALLGLFVLRDAYLCFVTGALLFEAHKRGWMNRLPAWAAALAFVLGALLGAPADGFADRIGLGMVPTRLQPGNAWGLMPVVAATLLLIAALRLAPFATLLSMRLPQWFGRISFALYLVHVPVLYTFVASAQLNLEMPPGLLFAGYVVFTLALAQAFTVLVDEPSLHLLQRARRRLERVRLPALPAAQPVPVVTQPLWGWVAGGTVLIMLPALINGAPFIYYDSVYYLSSTDRIAELLQLTSVTAPVSDGEAVSGVMSTAPALSDPAALTPGTAANSTEIEYRNRSVVFRMLASASQAIGGGWPLIALYGALTTWMLALIWTRGLTRRLTWRWLAAVGILSLLTPLGLFAGLAMPDLMAGVVVLAVALLVGCWHSLTRVQRGFLCVALILAMISHGSHLALGAALAGVLIVTTWRLPGATLGAAAVIASVGATVLLDTTYIKLRESSGDQAVIHRPHLTAHLIDSDVGTAYLQTNCPDAGFAVCAYADQAPIHWISFLFADHNLPHGPYANDPVGMAKALSAEQTRFAWAVFSDAPLRTLGFAVGASLEQMVRFGAQGVQIPSQIFDDRAETFPASVQQATRASAIYTNPRALEALTLTSWIVVLAALLFGVRAAPQLYRRMRTTPIPAPRVTQLSAQARLRQGLLIVGILITGAVLNAMICGILASPYDRFQARVV